MRTCKGLQDYKAGGKSIHMASEKKIKIGR